jgi:hypothetical protein
MYLKNTNIMFECKDINAELPDRELHYNKVPTDNDIILEENPFEEGKMIPSTQLTEIYKKLNQK